MMIPYWWKRGTNSTNQQPRQEQWACLISVCYGGSCHSCGGDGWMCAVLCCVMFCCVLLIHSTVNSITVTEHFPCNIVISFYFGCNERKQKKKIEMEKNICIIFKVSIKK